MGQPHSARWLIWICSLMGTDDADRRRVGGADERCPNRPQDRRAGCRGAARSSRSSSRTGRPPARRRRTAGTPWPKSRPMARAPAHWWIGPDPRGARRPDRGRAGSYSTRPRRTASAAGYGSATFANFPEAGATGTRNNQLLTRIVQAAARATRRSRLQGDRRAGNPFGADRCPRPGWCVPTNALQALDPDHPVVDRPGPARPGRGELEKYRPRLRHHRRGHLSGRVPAGEARPIQRQQRDQRRRRHHEENLAAAGAKPGAG